jgi:DNA ligase-1
MIVLYKKNSKGTVICWAARAVRGSAGINVSMISGELTGKQVETLRPNIKGKNIGKANETSPLEQAELEVAALYKRRKRLGYKSLEDLSIKVDPFAVNFDLNQALLTHLPINTTDAEGNLKPMKCQQYYRSKKNWTDPTGKVWADRKYYYLLNPHEPKEKGALIMKFPCYGQPKINGVRAFIYLTEEREVVITSKEGLDYDLPHIKEYFETRKEMFVFDDGESERDVIFDGELYIPGEILGDIVSAIRTFGLNTHRVEFHLFDIAIENIATNARLVYMREIYNMYHNTLETTVVRIVSKVINNDTEAQLYTNSCITDGHEGAIFRDGKAFYGFGKRPTTIVKLKRTISEEFQIVDIVRQDKNPELGLFVCVTKEGQEFKVTPFGDTTYKETILYQKHNIIGKMLTCTFYEYTEDKKPFHVITNIIRDYE